MDIVSVDGLTTEQSEFLKLIGRLVPIEESAKAIGVSDDVVSDWFTQDDFRREFDRTVLNIPTKSVIRAWAKVLEVLQSDYAKESLSAAKIIIQCGGYFIQPELNHSTFIVAM